MVASERWKAADIGNSGTGTFFKAGKYARESELYSLRGENIRHDTSMYGRYEISRYILDHAGSILQELQPTLFS